MPRRKPAAKTEVDPFDEDHEVINDTSQSPPPRTSSKPEIEFGTVSFAPICPMCDEGTKCYGTRGPIAYYRCENESCSRFKNYTVPVTRPERVRVRKQPQMNVAARPDMQ